MKLGRTLSIALSTLALAFPGHAETGVTDDAVNFVQIAALDGPAAQLGLGMQAGLEAAFAEINKKGGVHGRQILMEGLDDGYEPDRSTEHITNAIASEKYFGLIGSVGTPTATVLQPIATENDFPMIGAFTGAGFLRNPELGNVYNVRGSYDAETEEWIRILTEDMGLTRIAIFYQDDSFGRAGLSGVQKAMDRRGMSILVEGLYTRNTTDVKDALLAIREAEPEAVVMVGAYKPIGEFIKLSRSYEFTPEFVTISFVGSKALADELWPGGEGVIISQVVPFPWDDSMPIVADYQAALAEVDEFADYGFVSLEGYMVGRFAIEALERAGRDLTRENFLAAMENMSSFDLGGVELNFGPGDNQGIDTIFMTRLLPDGFFEPM